MAWPSAGRAPPAFLSLLVIAQAGAVVWGIWDTVRAPGNWVNYMQVTWSLCLAGWLISQHVRFTVRVAGLTGTGAGLAGLAIGIGNAVQAPGDWVSYVLVAWSLFFLVLVGWLVRRGARAGCHGAGTLAR
jgi:hypothetical protein